VTFSRRLAAAIVTTLALGVGTGATPSYAAGRGAPETTIRAQSPLGAAGVSSTVKGVKVSLQTLRSRPEPPNGLPREASPRREFGNAAIPSNGVAGTPVGPASSSASSPKLPQTVIDEILGPQITDTIGFVPPDTMGAVGPTQFLFSVNGRFRAFNKNSPHTQILDLSQVAFWGSTADAAGVSDAHVRYDRSTQRWFIVQIDVRTSDNHILLAVSSGQDLSTATWTQFAIAATGTTVATDSGCFADYPTPGIDQNGIYIGANMFASVSPCTGNYKHSNLYVIQKSSALTSTVNVTSFYNVVTGIFDVSTIQGVDSVDSLATGYAVAVKETENPRQHLTVWQINNPGSVSPTLSSPTDVAVNAENGSRGGVLSANNVSSPHRTRKMDDLGDRLFSAVIRNGHLWTAHNVAVDLTGNSNGVSPTRDAVRWYDVTVSGLTLNQSGTVFDSVTSGFLEYWMGTVMVSGQGHVAIGLNRANATTVVQAGAVGRLAGDTLGTMGSFSVSRASSAAAYDDGSFVTSPANRWGDFTYTSLDPCDDMTMWTAQEYVAGSAGPVGGLVDWGVAAAKLQAPPPATPASASPGSVQTGQPSVNVVVSGTSASGSGFYDTPSTITDPCRKRITATVSGGVIVNSVTYTDPTHITLNISTVSATLGTHTVTITNPDGQLAAAAVLTTTPAYVAGVVGTDNGLWALHSASSWTSFGGVLIGAPAVVAIPQTSGPAVPVYIATGGDHNLYVRSDSQSWQPLTDAPVYCIDNPAGVVIGATLYVACQGGDHALWHAETATPSGSNLPALSHSSWQSLGGGLSAGPAVVSLAGTPTYFVLGMDQHIYSRDLSASSFTGYLWSCLGHPALGTVGATTYFACHGADGRLSYATNSGSGWSSLQSLGGVLIDGVGLAALSSGPIFFVEGGDHAVWHRTISSGWASDGGQAQLGVAAAAM
jgi:hypothetical protein